MATYVNDLRLKEIGTGESSGTWGTETNVNLELIGEALGYATKALADASTGTLTIPDGTATNGEPRALYLKLTGGGQAQTVTLAPNTVSKTWIIDNGTSYALAFSQGSGANVSIAAGQTKVIATDGAGSGAAIYDCFTDLELAGAVTAATSFTAPLIEGSTSLQTPLIEYTDGDDAITIADGGGLTFASTTQANGTVTVGVNDTGYDVKFFGATSGKYWLWDESADGVVQQGTLTVGVDDTGYDVKFFGATSGAYMLWDESADDLKLVGAAGLTVAGDIDIDGTANLDVVDIDGAVDMATTLTLAGNADFNGDLDVDGTTNLDAVDIDGAVQIDGTVTVGVDDTGLDVKFFGATSGRFLLWDESDDALELEDSVKLKIGTGADLQLYHDGSNSLIEHSGTGDLYIRNPQVDADIIIQARSGENSIHLNDDGAVTLYHDNAAKLATTATGIDVTGIAVSDGMSTNTSGTSNFVAGVNAGNSIASGGNYNVAIGDEAGTAISTGDDNTAVGYAAGDAATTGSDNTFIGNNAGGAVTTASGHTAIGSSALLTMSTGTTGTAVGFEALKVATGNSNTAVGYQAGVAVSTGANNTLVGNAAGDAVSTGSENTFIGDSAGGANTTAHYNTAVGSGCFEVNSTGSYCAAIGRNALSLNSTGNSNSALGYGALTTNSTGESNTGVGFDALTQCTTASNNTAMGKSSLSAITTGSSNVGIGQATGASLTTGAYNVLIGQGVNVDGSTAEGQIVIGRNVASGGNDSVRFGQAGNTLSIALDGSTTSWTAASDERLKENIEPAAAGLSFINDLRPVTYNFRKAKDVPSDFPGYQEGSDEPCLGHDYGTVNHGFVAQEVKSVIDNHPEIKEGFNMWNTASDGIQHIGDGALVPMLVKAVQELSAKIKKLEEEDE